MGFLHFLLLSCTLHEMLKYLIEVEGEKEREKKLSILLLMTLTCEMGYLCSSLCSKEYLFVYAKGKIINCRE